MCQSCCCYQAYSTMIRLSWRMLTEQSTLLVPDVLPAQLALNILRPCVSFICRALPHHKIRWMLHHAQCPCN